MEYKTKFGNVEISEREFNLICLSTYYDKYTLTEIEVLTCEDENLKRVLSQRLPWLENKIRQLLSSINTIDK